MDDLDIKILREFITDVPNRCLQPDVTKSYIAISKNVGTTEDTVKNRVDKMCENGILRGWKLGVNPTLFRYRTDFFYFSTSSYNEKDKVIEKLKSISGVLWIVDYLGTFVGVLISSRDEKMLERKMLPIFSVISSKSFVRVSNQFPEVKKCLTTTDWKLIRSLMNDPRKKYSDISNELGISSRMARRKLKTMIEEHAFFMFPDINVRKIEGRVVVTYAIFYSDDVGKKESEKNLLTKFRNYFLVALPPENAYAAYTFILPNLSIADRIMEYVNALNGVRTSTMRPIVDFINLLDRTFNKEIRQKTVVTPLSHSASGHPNRC
ncbi:MAG: winged helix-turn-helix transcriptional regulator [Candidatus Thermoplasmatota archaeon]|jgi:DNA-binding Lrp family transcriptional regulator|nr:winged helix-turn-helix transcriptional regulator [Candidatus Thermoplasmatota archaeon]